MELVLEPDTYTPGIDEQGNYIDNMPSHQQLQKGIYCVCGCRVNKLFTNSSKLSAHMKTKAHQKWLHQLNLNKANFFIESENLKKTVRNQRILIAQLEKDNKNKSMTIDYLTQQLVMNSTATSAVKQDIH
jgi:hypothetical protein